MAAARLPPESGPYGLGGRFLIDAPLVGQGGDDLQPAPANVVGARPSRRRQSWRVVGDGDLRPREDEEQPHGDGGRAGVQRVGDQLRRCELESLEAVGPKRLAGRELGQRIADVSRRALIAAALEQHGCDHADGRERRSGCVIGNALPVDRLGNRVAGRVADPILRTTVRLPFVGLQRQVGKSRGGCDPERDAEGIGAGPQRRRPVPKRPRRGDNTSADLLSQVGE
jgi:hypothetical protein